MKSKIRFLLFIVLVLAFVFSACAKPVEEAEPTVTPTSRPKITPSPKKTMTPNEAFDYNCEWVQCQVDTTARDTKITWKIYMPTESPDPNWTVESEEDGLVIYSKITCYHETPDPYAFHPEETEGVAETDGAEEPAEVTPTPEG